MQWNNLHKARIKAQGLIATQKKNGIHELVISDRVENFKKEERI